MKIHKCKKCGVDGFMVYATTRLLVEELESVTSGINTKLLLCKKCGHVQEARLSADELSQADPNNTMLKEAE